MQYFKPLRTDLSKYLSRSDLKEIEKAYLVAEEAHKDQKRRSGEPYITHPVAVAQILAELKMDKQSIMAALLHDVIEDTAYDKNTLSERFGPQVAEMVDGLSKLTQIRFRDHAEAQAENFRKMLLAMSKDIRVIIIKLADRLHNMRTLNVLPPPKKRRIARETLEIYAPIAHRLGIHAINQEYENLGFEALYPHRYRVLKAAVDKVRGNRKEIISVIEKAIRNTLKHHKISVTRVWGREKHLYSIYKKMRREHLSFSEIMDVYTFSIVVDKMDKCYLSLGVVHNLYKPVPERFKDYIAIPKANGYQALHTSVFGPYGVPIQIQISTEEMVLKADKGIVAHWLRSSGKQNINDVSVRAKEWLNSLLEMQASSTNSLELIENVKIDLFPDEVYVFTPNGEIIELPVGATAVDFAYAVHSAIGNACVACKIDRRLAPLSTVLANGQTVEIVTAAGATPNPAWLHFIVTGKARSSIRYFLKNQRRVHSIELGKRLFEKSLEQHGRAIGTVAEEQWQQLLKIYQYKNRDDLFENIGLGNQAPQLVVERFGSVINGGNKQDKISGADRPLLIKGSEGMVVHFAKCCRPIPYEPIVALLTPGRGIVVHSDTCSQVTAFRNKPEVCVNVCWEERVQGEFAAAIRAIVTDQKGVLAKLTHGLAEQEAGIDNISIVAKDGIHATIDFVILVRDLTHLERIMSHLRTIDTVSKIIRVRSNK